MKPINFAPAALAVSAADAINALSGGTSPPPVRIAIFFFIRT